MWVLLIATMFTVLGLLNFGQRVPELKEGEAVELILGPEYPEKVHPLLKSAQKRLWLAVYVASYHEDRTFSIQNKFFQTLVERYKKGVDVRVILDESYDWDSAKNRPSKKRSTKNDAVFQYLKNNGVPVFMDSYDQIMHGKFVVIDDLWIVLGSTNWTYSALSKNVEVSTIIKNREINQQMEEFFQKLWNQSEKGQIFLF